VADRIQGVTDTIGFWLASLPLETFTAYNYYNHAYHDDDDGFSDDVDENEDTRSYAKGVFVMAAMALKDYYDEYDLKTQEEQNEIFISGDRTQEFLIKAWRHAYDAMTFSEQKGY